MSAALPLARRYWGWGLAVLALIALISFTAAPASNRLTSGSTWNRAPDGYSAWYDYMAEQGNPVQRWQRPLENLIEPANQAIGSGDTAATLIQVYPSVVPRGISQDQYQWLQAGHTLVLLGQQVPVTAAPFETQQPSPVGPIILETRRRAQLSDREAPLLEDEYGAIAWRFGEEQGQVIAVATPHLGANAYSQAAGNFAFLAELARQAGGPIWVDEYLHGYKDSDVVMAETGGTWLGYLAQTPLAVALVQLGLLVLVGILAQNRRLGTPRSFTSPVVDNSEAYIQALAGVLHKAGSHDFVVSTLSRAERLALQKHLGLGDAPVPDTVLQTTWEAITGEPAQTLNVILTPPSRLARDQDLATWLSRLQTLHQSLLKRSPAR